MHVSDARLVKLESTILEKHKESAAQIEEAKKYEKLNQLKCYIVGYDRYIKKINNLIPKILEQFLIETPKKYEIIETTDDDIKSVAWQLHAKKTIIYGRKIINKYYIDCAGSIVHLFKEIELNDFGEERQSHSKFSIIEISYWKYLSGYDKERYADSPYELKWKKRLMSSIFFYLWWLYVKSIFFKI